MDIKTDKLYYYLKMKDGEYYIFLREQIVSPSLNVTQLDIYFDNEDAAKDCVEKLNNQDNNGRN